MGDEKPSNFGAGGALEVSGETTASAEPCKRAFDGPTSRQELEALDPGWSLDNLDGPLSAMGECFEKLFAAVNPVGKDVSKLGKALSQALQERDSTMDVLNIGGMNVDCQQKSIGIGDDVPLASMNSFARIEAAWTAGLCCRSTLAIDDGRRRCRLAAEFSSSLPDQSPDDPVPSSRVAPRIKIALHRRIGWELAWQSPPLTAGRQNVENRLHDLPQIGLARSPEPSAPRHLPGNQRPFRIRQIACITKSTTLILDTSDFGPRHRVLPRIFANPKESQPGRNHSPFFSQALRSREAASRRMAASGLSWFETALR